MGVVRHQNGKLLAAGLGNILLEVEVTRRRQESREDEKRRHRYGRRVLAAIAHRARATALNLSYPVDPSRPRGAAVAATA